jgi:hypothetical protein
MVDVVFGDLLRRGLGDECGAWLMAIVETYVCDECGAGPQRPLIVHETLDLEGWGKVPFGRHFCGSGCLLKALHKALTLGVPNEAPLLKGIAK